MLLFSISRIEAFLCDIVVVDLVLVLSTLDFPQLAVTVTASASDVDPSLGHSISDPHYR